MAKEYSGVLLLIATLLRSAEGRQILSSCRKKNFNDDWLIADWSLLVETLLQWEAFLKQPEMPKNLVKKFLDKKHRFIMYLIKKVARRSKGMGLKILKFHAIVHMVNDILLFGVPMNYDTGSNESHHKETKVAAKMTQKDLANFEKSTAFRLWEFHIIRLALEEINNRPLWAYIDGYYDFDVEDDNEQVAEQQNECNAQDGDISGQNDNDFGQEGEREDEEEENLEVREDVWTGGTQIKVSFNPESREAQFEFPGSRMDKNQHVGWENSIVYFLLQVQAAVIGHMPDPFLPIRTEHRRHGVIFRGHPCYRKKGVWMDWVRIDWGNDDELPAQIWCFIDLRSLDGVVEFGDYSLEKGVYAVVESTTYDEDDDEFYSSSLFKPIVKEVETMVNGKTVRRKYYLADVDAFIEPLVVVPNIGSKPDNQYFEVKPRQKWAEEFEEWLEIDDEEEITNDDD